MTQTVEANENRKERVFKTYKQFEETFFPKSAKQNQSSFDELPFDFINNAQRAKKTKKEEDI